MKTHHHPLEGFPMHIAILLTMLAFVMTACESPFSPSRITPAPTPQCVEPTLTLGTLAFKVDSVTREANAFPEIPRKRDMAYWVEGTTIHYVFGLGATRDNLGLNTVLKAGDPAIITWADCTRDEYVIQSIDAFQPNDLSLFDQTSGGITVFVQDRAAGLVIRGGRPILQAEETPIPLPEDAIQVDLQILEFSQPDDQTINFRILITNQGARTITLTMDDVAMFVENVPEVPPRSVEPALPQELQPGDLLPLSLTFPKPQAPSAVLRIFDVTFEYYFP